MMTLRSISINVATICIALCISQSVLAQRLVNWTEAQGELGLGYPVPIPQDTPLPFDGFRSYFSLRARHLDIANTNDAITRVVIGQTQQSREINMYVLSDDDATTIDGRIEGSVLLNGGIHAREWQSPEVTTGLIELLDDQSNDQHFYQYLLENMNIAVIPVLNVDGFLQTQRFPSQNYLDSDPDNPATSPRDGRMRRKNMRGVDQNINTAFDLLQGIDLNRNNPPFYATSGDSSPNPASIIYHGTAPFSEGETQSLSNAPNSLLPGSELITIGDRLRMYIDLHSFTRILIPVGTNNIARNGNQQAVMSTLTRHHAAIPDGRLYSIAPLSTPGFGIGVTPEYFANTFEVPAWTLELEPTRAAGAEYGGFNNNGHDGFILPESEIRRVRENMAASLAASAYHQAGPPSIQSIRVVTADTRSLVFESRQSLTDSSLNREQQQLSQRVLQPGEAYLIEIGFDKPMRWLDDEDNVTVFPGQFASTVNLRVQLETTSGNLTVTTGQTEWPTEPGFFGGGYQNYKTDVAIIPFTINDDANNEQLISGNTNVNIAISGTDMVGFGLDSNPSTAIDWQNGDWVNYETEPSQIGLGSTDRSTSLIVSDAPITDSFTIDPTVSGTWQSRAQDGIGYIIEILPDGRVVTSWATYDESGNQRWLIGVGEQLGNRIVVDSLTIASGASFGTDFDPADVIRQSNVGSLEFTFSGCDIGQVNYRALGEVGQLTDLVPTTQIAGIGCNINNVQLPPLSFVSGSWFDISHDGEGFTIHALPDGRVIVYWYSFDSQGNQRWFIGVGNVDDDNRIVINDVTTTSNAQFGNAFNPDDVVRTLWGEVIFELACDTGTVTYDSIDPEFGSGALNLIRLTSIDGVNCPN